ncbi:MAG: phosphatidylglycerophosphatase A [Chitinophagales bacterium]|nr:phosphatidylglycerophosphatase A [Chitinophagales bacterium]MCZ2394091.1 phosphatidylglycerophosphatase A [Chitinophagales bacterium]
MKGLKLWLSSGLGSGYLPKSPGTWGSLLSLIFIYFILQSSQAFFLLLIFVVVCILINLWVANISELTWGKDPSRMVIDEFAGQSVAFLSFAFHSSFSSMELTLLLGFIFFRFFDIVKPLGIYQLQKFKGGWGILLDDLLAGIYSMICLEIIFRFIL